MAVEKLNSFFLAGFSKGEKGFQRTLTNFDDFGEKNLSTNKREHATIEF